ncbi:ATP-binding protein [Candidatus Viridilinea mediisalina]|uniref:Type IV secretion system coupling protein TraD DNA-binding domain-containing protein n=1 Tax=Candidatus Viridilinea mediisalina TaxID=2024553 RepID=A0A2A6RPX0_9CHLR|nr:ATP-binding protein [Candidatus Viridilinea mediisalina]PDW05067.1 hypothetical protein CJ255_00300 [Candidatus Viridilinea mediisalina]
MMPRSPSTQGGAASPSRVPPRTQSPRWHGNPDQRPPTDAEVAKGRRRQRSLARFFGIIGLLLVGGFVLAPTPVLLALTQAPPALAPLSARVGWWLQVAYPFVKLGLVAVLSYVILHLIIGAGMIARQISRRRTLALSTVLVELPRTPAADLGRGVDLFAGLGEILSPAGRLQGSEDRVVFALVNGMADHRVRLAVRTPAGQATQVASTDALRNLLSGEAPGTTTRPASDDVSTMLTQHQDSDGPQLAGYADYMLARTPSYPLKDLAMFVGGDPLGPLATALTRQDGVSYAAFEVMVRALPPKEDWRAPLRERIGQIQGTVNPEDLAAYEALVRKVESHGFDVVVRCIVAAQTRDAALRQLRAMHHALRTFSRPAGDARQSLMRVGSRMPGRTPGFHLIPLTPATIGAAPLPTWGLPTIIGAVITALAGAAGGMTLAQGLLRIQALLPSVPIALPTVPTGLLEPVLAVLCALAGLLLVLARSPRRRAARARDRLATLGAHAHQPIWPGYRWTLFPAPGKQRSILGPYELAAFWHPPSLDLEAQFAWRSSKHLPAPVAAFLSPAEAAAAESRQVQPRPATPHELGRARLGLAYAQQRDGALALIGPTLRDLRQGWDTMGGMGSGKSSLVETMVYEIARLGGGCGVIDAKGDLCDRLLRILPPEAYDRVIVIDTTAAWVPCINPFDRRLIRDKPRDVVAGEIGQIFARIEPEIWAGALGMQQALFMGISALLEGEHTPSLVHLERFYLAPSYRDEVLSRVVDKAIRDYWLVQVPAMPEKIKTSIDSLKRRLTGLVGSETGQRLLCQPASTIDLTKAMREQAIVIIKFVPEKIGETNAAFWGAALFQSIVSATFAQQAETDPEQRWDWPLFVDEVQMFVKAERAEDAERMWTRTRSMGVGLVGAHQGLNQLGEKLGGIVLNVIGGMCLTSGVRDDTRDLVNAYANQGLQPEDFTGVKPREELLIRFPVQSRDMGLMSAIPRDRPPEQPAPEQHATAPVPFTPASPAEACDLATLEAIEQGVNEALATHPDLLPETVYRAVAHDWLSAIHQECSAALVTEGKGTSASQLSGQAWTEVQHMVERLRAVATRRAQHDAQHLAQSPRTLPADQHLAQLSQQRYGVHPLINACYVAALVRRYPTDELSMAQQDRGRRQRDAGRSPIGPAVTPPAVPGPPGRQR